MSVDSIPVELLQVGPRRMVRWMHPGDGPVFTQPFFSQSVDALSAGHAVQKLTPIDALLDVDPANAPRGLIFHVARCGSTLVSRSLGAVARHRVISEAGPVNQLLLDATIDAQLKARVLKGLIHALCGSDPHRACFIKFSSWNLLFIAQIRALFPTTPWLFVYRAPADVWQSLSKRPAHWSASKPLGRVVAGADTDAGPDTLVALERFYAAPLAHFDALALAVDYTQLPAALPAICAHFGLLLDAAEHAQIERISAYDAKQTGEVAFRPRAREALPDDVAAALAPIDALYRQWERIRALPPAARVAAALSASASHVATSITSPASAAASAVSASAAPRAQAGASAAPHSLASTPASAPPADASKAALLAKDARLIALVDAGQLARPANELLANAYRRRGDLSAAAADYARLVAAGCTTPAVARMDAVLRQAPSLPMSASDFAPAPFVLMQQALGAAANGAALAYAVACEPRFHPTELQQADYHELQRACLVTYDVGPPGALIDRFVRAQLPLLCERLAMPLFAIRFVQLKIAAYATGDFFKVHQDNGLTHSDRRISFVYYFNDDTQPFSGGELLLYDSRFAPRAHVRTLFTAIAPRNDSIVFFPSEFFHEVLPVITATSDFRACRFTLAGHLG